MVIQLPSGDSRADHKVHQQKRGNVKKRAYRPQPQHKPADPGSIPLFRAPYKLCVHIVPGKSRTGKIIDQVQQKQLDGFHGQERQKGTCCQHRKHVSEIGGSSHLDVFHHIGVSLPSLNDPLLKDHQILFQKHHRGGLSGNVHRSVHRDSHIGGPHGGCVIDAVAHVTYAVSIFPEHSYDSGLLLRRKLCEYLDRLCFLGQFPIIHILQLFS